MIVNSSLYRSVPKFQSSIPATSTPQPIMKETKSAVSIQEFNGGRFVQTRKLNSATQLHEKTTDVITRKPEAAPESLQNQNGVTSTSTEIPESSPCHEHHPSRGWKWLPRHLTNDQLWQRIRQEAAKDAEAEATLASFLHSSVLAHSSIPRTMAFILANKLASPTLLGTHLMRLIQDIYEDEPFIIDACCADMQAVFERDPACDKYTQCMLYFKGFQAVQSHRVAHWLWNKGRKPLALALQSRISEVFHVDIHPAAVLGRGIFVDHATGVVIGETAVVCDNVSMLHHVTLGGSGTGKGKRHPTVGHGVLLGAGVSILGPVTIGCGTKIGAGAVVVQDLPMHCVAVGVPARVIKRHCVCEPITSMDQCKDFIPNYQI